jgi:hypothetical protein
LLIFLIRELRLNLHCCLCFSDRDQRQQGSLIQERQLYSRRGRNSLGRQQQGARNIRQGQVHRENWSEPFTLYSDSQPRDSTQRRYGNSSRGKAWNFPTIRVDNNNSPRLVDEVEVNYGRREKRASALDPKIQEHISYIQAQGRRIRGEEKYDPTQGPTTTTVSVSYSGISLSDRFKMFME